MFGGTKGYLSNTLSGVTIPRLAELYRQQAAGRLYVDRARSVDTGLRDVAPTISLEIP
jgi:hypothetical protein